MNEIFALVSKRWPRAWCLVGIFPEGNGKCALVAGGDHFVAFWTLRVFLRVPGRLRAGFALLMRK